MVGINDIFCFIGKLLNIYIVCNMFLFYFQGSIKIKVEVWDFDDNGDDYVDFLYFMFRVVFYYNVFFVYVILYIFSVRIM